MNKINGDNHMLDADPQDYLSALAAYRCANIIIAFRDLDVRQLLREIDKLNKRLNTLEAELKLTKDNYEELEELYEELKNDEVW